MVARIPWVDGYILRIRSLFVNNGSKVAFQEHYPHLGIAQVIKDQKAWGGSLKEC